jgi:hypothetical protein
MLKQGRVVALDTHGQSAGAGDRRPCASSLRGDVAPAACRPRCARAARQDDGSCLLPLARSAASPALRRRLACERCRRDRSLVREPDLEEVFVRSCGRPMSRFRTLLYKELLRFWKVSFQTIARRC